MRNVTDSPLQASNQSKGLLDEERSRLARMILALVPYDGAFNQRIPGLLISRFSRIDSDTVNDFNSPSLLFAVQGEKVITVGQQVYTLDKSEMLMFPVALPVTMQTTNATSSEPFLGIRLDLDSKRISELVLKVYAHGLPPLGQRSAGYTANIGLSIMKAVSRLLDCLSDPGDTEWIAPLVMDEILIRILRSPFGKQAAEMGFADSGVQRVAKAIAWLRSDFSQKIKITDLADLVHMSVSSFNEHFKSVTSMSPLQYQKALRLHEARRLMFSESKNASTASRLVGYISISQFSRDYSRFFGISPSRDIAKWRQQEQIPHD